MNNAIEVRGLCKDYGDFRLDHVDLTVPGGTILGPDRRERQRANPPLSGACWGLVRPDGRGDLPAGQGSGGGQGGHRRGAG